nr:MAG TPA: hypothetical protein [Caudoviricetes sp.]
MQRCRPGVPSYLRCCGHNGAAGKKEDGDVAMLGTPRRQPADCPASLMPPLDRARWILPE